MQPPSARLAFIRRTYAHLAGAVVAFVGLSGALLASGMAEQIMAAAFARAVHAEGRGEKVILVAAELFTEDLVVGEHGRETFADHLLAGEVGVGEDIEDNPLDRGVGGQFAANRGDGDARRLGLGTRA